MAFARLRRTGEHDDRDDESTAAPPTRSLVASIFFWLLFRPGETRERNENFDSEGFAEINEQFARMGASTAVARLATARLYWQGRTACQRPQSKVAPITIKDSVVPEIAHPPLPTSSATMIELATTNIAAKKVP